MSQRGRCFVKRTTKLFGQGFTLLGRNLQDENYNNVIESTENSVYLSLGLQIQLVSNQHQRDVLSESNTRNKLPILGRLLEAVSIGDRVANNEAFSAAHVLITHGSELDLARSVQDIQQGCFAINDRLLLIRVLDRWIMIVEEAVAHELERDG